MSARKQGVQELKALERAIAAKRRVGERQLGLRSSEATLPALASPATHATYPLTPQPLKRESGGEPFNMTCSSVCSSLSHRSS